MPDAPEGQIVHQTPRRVRIRIPAKRHDRRFFAATQRNLSRRPAVEHVEINPLTASILVHSSDSKAFLEALEYDAPFTVAGVLSQEQVSPLVEVRQQLLEWNRQLGQLTGGRHDARAYIFLALVLGATYQLARGEIFAPAATLLWYAGEALRIWLPPHEAASDAAGKAAEDG